MSKYEFLNQLGDYLEGYVSAAEKQDSLNYYRDYIEEEMNSGKTEQEIIDELGSPSGIAKSIIEARGLNSNREDSYNSYDAYEEEGREEYEKNPVSGKIFYLESWKMGVGLVLLILIVLLILSFVFKIVAFFVPIVLPVLIIMFIFKMLNNRR